MQVLANDLETWELPKNVSRSGSAIPTEIKTIHIDNTDNTNICMCKIGIVKRFRSCPVKRRYVAYCFVVVHNPIVCGCT